MAIAPNKRNETQTRWEESLPARSDGQHDSEERRG